MNCFTVSVLEWRWSLIVHSIGPRHQISQLDRFLDKNIFIINNSQLSVHFYLTWVGLILSGKFHTLE
jgi:hypothetical protein